MPGALYSIARSGAAAARASLELTAQNIANSANPDFSRRSLGVSELAGSATIGVNSADSLGGVKIGSIERADSAIVQQQARSSASELARADAELAALRSSETALEQSRLFEGLVEFEAVLTRLESDPLDPTLRTSALETARQLASTFQFADTTLGNARSQTQTEASFGVETINRQTQELARINRELVGAREGSAGKATLLDARDAALRDLSREIGIDARFEADGTVEVRVNGSPSPLLVAGPASEAVAMSQNADGTLAFSVGSVGFAPANGAIAGRTSALAAMADSQRQLDDIAAATIARSNDAQADGVDSSGNPGQPLFAGSNAGEMTLALGSGAGWATAPAGSPAGSTNSSNLAAFVSAIGADDGPIAGQDTLLLGLSSRIAAQDVTRGGLAAIAENAEAALALETGVDLDAEAANLVRLQQAFEANGRVLQVANDLFDTILGLR